MGKRKSSGDGMIRKRKGESRWECRIMDGYTKDGQRKIVTFYGKTEAEVKKKRNEYNADKEAGLDKKQKYTLGEFADIWYERHKKNISVTTQEHYKYILRTIKAHLGNRNLNDIEAFEVEDFLDTLEKEGKSDSYISGCRGMLTQIYKRAEAYRLVNWNPSQCAEKRKARGQVKPKDSFDMYEIQRMMEELPDTLIGWTIRIMLGTGMRPQEAIALEPRHIAVDGSWIKVEQAVVRDTGSARIGPPKTMKSRRVIPIPDFLRPCAMKMRDTDENYIWKSTKTPYPVNPSTFNAKFTACLKELDGVRVLTPHCCRVSYISHMERLGVTLDTVRKLAGHTTLKMTEHYLRIQEPAMQDAISKFSQCFAPLTVDAIEEAKQTGNPPVC
jgi:integrase